MDIQVRRTSPALALAALLAFAPGADAKGLYSHNAQLTALRHVTAPFHTLQNAMDAGWTDDITGCLAHPTEGAMGHHYVNWDVFFDGTVNALQPELLVYAPTRTGGRQLVAVEYLVFDSELVGPVPELFGQTFHFNPDIEAWVLHVWAWRGNPNGLFADWNPTVRCY